jgi:hypothetical protein
LTLAIEKSTKEHFLISVIIVASLMFVLMCLKSLPESNTKEYSQYIFPTAVKSEDTTIDLSKGFLKEITQAIYRLMFLQPSARYHNSRNTSGQSQDNTIKVK